MEPNYRANLAIVFILVVMSLILASAFDDGLTSAETPATPAAGTTTPASSPTATQGTAAPATKATSSATGSARPRS